MIRGMDLAGILITIMVGMLGIILTWRITRPIRQMTRVAEKIIGGDLNQVVDEISRDEIGVLARTFNLMTGKINQSMENLRKSEEKYRGIFENALEGLFQISVKGRFVGVNPAMAHILGYDSPEDLIEGMTDITNQVYVHPKDGDELNAIISDQKDISGFELQVYRKDRVKIWLSINARMVHDDEGNPAYIEGFVTDISRRKNAEEEKLQLESRLTQAQKMESIGTLAGGIAHDFNNILSAIIGFSELAMMDIEHNEKVLKALKQVHKAGIRAKELVKQILTFSRMTETEYSPIALKYIINDSLKMLRSVIPSTIEIKSHLSVDGLVMSDATQIHQIMMNLCTNAVHAMGENGGLIEVRLQDVSIDHIEDSKELDLAPGPYVLISIRDTGAGIPPDVMDRIFEPYFTTKEPGRGTGLGLSVIHGIVKSHKGAIKCKSVLQKGTTFDVYLPRIETDQTNMDTPEKTTFPTGHERILFVDDEKELANLAVDILGRMGFHVVAKTSSTEALSLFCENPDGFDLVITDMTMPVMTGDRMAAEMILIRHDIPIILCTGYHENFSEHKARTIGIKEFIMKPLDIRTLAETIRKVLDRN
jgi:PAS domain S-box-containing protein